MFSSFKILFSFLTFSLNSFNNTIFFVFELVILEELKLDVISLPC